MLRSGNEYVEVRMMYVIIGLYRQNVMNVVDAPLNDNLIFTIRFKCCFYHTKVSMVNVC